MKLVNKLMAALCLALAVCLAVCAVVPAGIGAARAEGAISNVALSKTKAALYSGKTLQLKLDGARGKVIWSSSDNRIAAVNGSGLVTAKLAGKCTISAVAGKKKYDCALTVKAPLWVDKKAVTLAVGESVDVKLTWIYTAGLSMSYDNSAVVTAKFSKKWTGNTTTVKLTAVGEGNATVTISNKKTKDVAKIRVTVQNASQRHDVSGLMGLTVKAANRKLADPLKKAGSVYNNGYISAALDTLGRINRIAVFSGEGGYTLFSVRPGMKATKAVSELKSRGWKLGQRTSGANIYVSAADTAHAVRLEYRGGKVTQVVYFVP